MIRCRWSAVLTAVVLLVAADAGFYDEQSSQSLVSEVLALFDEMNLMLDVQSSAFRVGMVWDSNASDPFLETPMVQLQQILIRNVNSGKFTHENENPSFFSRLTGRARCLHGLHG